MRQRQRQKQRQRQTERQTERETETETERAFYLLPTWNFAEEANETTEEHHEYETE